MDGEMLSNLCLFCACPCSFSITSTTPPQVAHDGAQGKEIKFESEPELITADDYESPQSQSPPPPLFLKEDSLTLAKQLKVIFILSKILGIHNDKLCQFLEKPEGDLQPQDWVKVCGPCEQKVRDHWRISKEIARLKREQDKIGMELKGRIYTTKDIQSENSTSNSIWKEVREGVSKELATSATTVPHPPPPPAIVIENDESLEEILFTQVKTILPVDDDDDDEEEDEDSREYDTQLNPTSSEMFISGDLSNDEDDYEKAYHFGGGDNPNFSFNLGETHPPQHQKQNESQAQLPKNSVKDVKRLTNGKIKTYPLEGVDPSKYPKYLWSKEKMYSLYKCLECSFHTGNFGKVFKPHLELHRPGSKGISCELCGWLLDPQKMRRHKLYYHANGVVKKKRGYVSPRLQYKCEECGAQILNRLRVEEHQKLHLEGKGVQCQKCGWLCKNIKYHKKVCQSTHKT